MGEASEVLCVQTFQGLLGGILNASRGEILFNMTMFFACKTLSRCANHLYALINPHSVFPRNEDLGGKFVDVLHHEVDKGRA